MVLSNAKLKRKRKEEAAALVTSTGAVPETPGTPVEVEKKRKKEKKEKEKKQRTNAVRDVEVAATVLNGTVGAEELQVSKENEKKGKKEKKKEKKRRKLSLVDAVSLDSLSASRENGVQYVDNRTEEPASSGGVKAEQPADENAAVASVDEKPPMSVREKKGKKKKAAKDRWGAKIADDVQEDGNPVETAVERETQPRSISAEESYEPMKVFVGGMPYYSTEDDIHEYFSECGVISELDCVIFPDTGNFRGIAFITFTTEDGATKALEYDGADMGGRFLKIERCKLKPRRTTKDPEQGEVQKTPGSTSAYIGNLSWDITEDAIKSFFKKSYSDSKIDSIRLSFDKITGDFKGFGHIDFGDDESLEAAVVLSQTPLLGRPVKIAYAVPPRQGSGDGGNRNNNFANGTSENRLKGACYNCGEDGHKSFLCPKKGADASYKSESRKVGACYNCGEEGHKSFLCPNKKVT